VIGLALLHGWGYGPDVWAGWAAEFPERPVALLDAGFFGPPAMALPDNPDGWLGVGHSLGFARLLGLDVPWRGLAGFGAFLRFCRLPGRADGTPPEIIDAMLARLDADPADVLRRFTRRCGREERRTAPAADGLERLRQGLRELRGLDLPAPAQPVPTLIVHAADDRIVPQSLAEAAGLRLAARLERFASGGHALPFARTAECARLVREFLHGLA
jgi:pimeloyl-ACP methyl ester carboxylesterase